MTQTHTAGENGVRSRKAFAEAAVCFGDNLSEAQICHATPGESALKILQTSFPERRWDHTIDGIFSPVQQINVSSKESDSGQKSSTETPNPSLDFSRIRRSRSPGHASSQPINAQQICQGTIEHLDFRDRLGVSTSKTRLQTPAEVASTQYFRPGS